MMHTLLHIEMWFSSMQQRDAAAAPQAKMLFVRLTTPRSTGT